ncbi:SUMF1/EgtB/PvdO family nonheme iron enzyme [Dyella sp.]|jgi:formylglycine-generating enzyme required for sulfatase activity|uniref:SUMF1/EgtB/PvdO family nonheme iron enzyme n=1 Tax=Dyella sp. TaxID=1869338 RepID=UPI002D765DFF|nr:SUMF1/EgtB/PvdO family nonheme iron enzyme [Dyella sp.]HET6432423.1 SUMF1/EgtB/PvdO family nonheme iron enzyme [Dyella sp.]
MASSTNVARQRTLGGAIGVLVLAFALTYHFFPRVFHVNPEDVAPRRSMSLGAASPTPVRERALVSPGEIDAGPPLTLAPAEVIAARTAHRNPDIPAQKGEDPPEVQALLARADKALHAGQVAGASDSAAALYQQALKLKPDSRRALEGLYEARARLVAAVGQDIAVGDAEAAGDLLDSLRELPGADEDVETLADSLATLVKVRPMLARAAALLEQGKADRPADDNALAVYRQVLTLDPQNAVAQQGLLQVQRAVLDRALAAVAQNDFAGADQALAEAQAIQADSLPLRDVRARVEGMRDQRTNGLLAQARSALDSGNLALAEKLAGEARAIRPDLPGLEDFQERLVNARLYANYRPGQTFADNFVDMPGKAPAMVVIPTGSFSMGAADNEPDRADTESPQHPVTLSRGIALGRTEITVGQFREFVRSSGYRPQSLALGGSSIYDERSGVLREDPRASWEDDYAGHSAADALPVVNVSWNDARAYVEWLAKRTGKAYRLPSEAEFEYALRAGTRTRYWWGDGSPEQRVENLTGGLDRSRNGRRWSNAFRTYRDGYWGPAPVMSFKPNPFGLYDINGNVSEWVADCWHDSYLRAPRDGSAWINPGCSAHVVRGGSWGSAPDQDRSAYRQGVEGQVRSARVGFRVAREL